MYYNCFPSSLGGLGSDQVCSSVANNPRYFNRTVQIRLFKSSSVLLIEFHWQVTCEIAAASGSLRGIQIWQRNSHSHAYACAYANPICVRKDHMSD